MSAEGTESAPPLSHRTLRYDDFAIHLQARGEGRYQTRILHSLAGGGSSPFGDVIDPDRLDDLLARLGEAVRRTGPPRLVVVDPRSMASRSDSFDPRALGGDLHAAALGGRVGAAWAFHLGHLSERRDRGLRLRLVFDPETLEETAIACWPWELIHLDRARGYLALDRRTPVVRHLDVPHPTVLPPLEPPLRVLLVAANADGYPTLSLAEEEHRIREAWTDSASVELEVLEETSIGEIREKLLRGRYHVLHFMGHGELLEPAETGGALVLRAPGGAPDPVPAAIVAESLRGLQDLRLAVLSACDTAHFPRHRGRDPYNGVAAAMVLSGLPAVVAMQFPISDRAAIAFGRGLYRALAANDPVDAAVTEGRISIVQEDHHSLEWVTPVLFSRLSAGTVLGPPDGAASAETARLRDRVLDLAPLIQAKTRGFVGRRFLFQAIENFRTEAGRGYFELVAEPGVGKSALVAEMVRRDGWVHHFNQRATNVTRPEAFLSNVCSQLALAFGLELRDLPAEATRDGSFLSRLLRQVSRRLASGSTTMLFIDALDEASGDGLPPGVNPLFLPPSLPEGIVVVVTSRPRRPDLSPRTDGPHRVLELDPDDDLNMADIRAYVESYLEDPGVRTYCSIHRLAERELAERLAEKSEGNFMYLSYVLPALAAGDYRDRPLDEIPTGLRQYYEGHFARIRGRDREVWLRETWPVLEVLAVTPDALPFRLIHTYSGVAEPRRVRQVLSELRPFLTHEVRGTENGPVPVYRFYHETFAEFLRESPSLSIDRQAVHRRIVEAHLDGRLDDLI